MAGKRSLTDLEIREVKTLVEKRDKIRAQLKDAKAEVKDLKFQLSELKDADIVKDYGVSKSLIYSIRTGRAYKTIGV